LKELSWMKMREDLAQAVMEAHRLASTRTLWPQWDFARTPLVLHSQEVSYIVGHPTPPKGYVELDPVAERRVHMGPTLPEMAANTAREIAGTISALVGFSKEPVSNKDEFARLILHECFHAHQLEALSAVGFPDFRAMQIYPENDPENNAMSIVENRILCSALKADLESPSRAKTLAAAFLTVRLARHKHLAKAGLGEVCLYEERSEFNEGTPTYVEVKAGKPVTELIDTLSQCNAAGKWAAYRRFYATGAAMALLLDILAPDWHRRLAEGKHTLQSLLAEALRPSDTEVTDPDMTEVDVTGAAAAEILRNNDYASILASEEASARERAAMIGSMLRELSEGPGIRVEIEVPEGAFTLFNPNRVIVIKPGVKLHPTLSGLRGAKGLSVDISCLCLEEAQARQLTLRVPEPPIPRQSGARITSLEAEGLTVSAPEGLEVAVDADGTRRIRFL
jgi:hypothetical protein